MLVFDWCVAPIKLDTVHNNIKRIKLKGRRLEEPQASVCTVWTGSSLVAVELSSLKQGVKKLQLQVVQSHLSSPSKSNFTNNNPAACQWIVLLKAKTLTPCLVTLLQVALLQINQVNKWYRSCVCPLHSDSITSTGAEYKCADGLL